MGDVMFQMVLLESQQLGIYLKRIGSSERTSRMPSLRWRRRMK